MPVIKYNDPSAKNTVPKEWIDAVDKLVAKHGPLYSNIIQACATIVLSAELMLNHHSCNLVEKAVGDQRDAISLFMRTMTVLDPTWRESIGPDLHDLIAVGLDLWEQREDEAEAMEQQSSSTCH